MIYVIDFVSFLPSILLLKVEESKNMNYQTCAAAIPLRMPTTAVDIKPVKLMLDKPPDKNLFSFGLFDLLHSGLKNFLSSLLTILDLFIFSQDLTCLKSYLWMGIIIYIFLLF